MMRRRGWSLRTRLTALLVAALLPLAGLGAFWILRETQEERLRVQHEAEMEAEGIADLAARRVAAVREMLATLARLPAVRAGDLSAVSTQAGREEADRLFRDLLAHSPDLENMGLINPDGTVVVSAVVVPPAQRVTVQDRDWFQQALRSGRPAVGGFQIGRITGTPNVILAHPVLDDAGQVTAVITAVLRLAAVSQEVTGEHLRDHLGHEPSVIWAVVDGQGLTLLHSDVRAAFGTPWTFPPGVLRAEAVVPGTPWRAVVPIPEAVVTARVRQLLLLIGLPGLSIYLVAVTLGFWIARNTWRPLQALATAVRRIGAGEPDVPVSVEGGGEVSEVASAFAETLEVLAAGEADIRRHAQELATLNDLTRTLTTVLDSRAVARAILAAAQALIPQSAGRLWERVGGEDVVRLVASVGLREPEGGLTLKFRPGEGLTGIAAATRQPVTSRDVTQDPRLINKEWAAAEGLVSCIVLPLIYGERVTGALAVLTRAPHDFTDEEVGLLQSFAAQAAIAIENARLYEEIRHRAATLDARVRERTAELEEALRVKAQFLATMSHELRTPLNHVIGFAELLQGETAGGLTPKQAQYVDRIYRGGKRLLELVSAILDLSMVEAGKSGLQLEPVPLAPLVQEVLDLVRVPVAQKRLEITTALDPELPIIVADRRKLGQILAHLVGNAVKFTPEGGTIAVRAQRVPGGIADFKLEIADWETQKAQGRRQEVEAAVQSEIANLQSEIPGDFAEIAVEDTGIGIKAEDLERSFAPFHQVDGSESRAHEGAGLGLSLVRQLVELHGGKVWAESAGPDQGARFIVRLPRLVAPPDTHPAG